MQAGPPPQWVQTSHALGVEGGTGWVTPGTPRWPCHPGQEHLKTQDIPAARCGRVSWGITPHGASGSSRRIPSAARNETLLSLQPRSWVPWGDGAAQPLGEIWEQLSPRVQTQQWLRLQGMSRSSTVYHISLKLRGTGPRITGLFLKIRMALPS